MITEQGVIEKIHDNKAVIRIQKGSACAHCESRGACLVTSNKEALLEVKNDLQAHVGDQVELSVPERALVKLSLLVYLLPIIALVIGAFAGGAWAESIRIDPTLASILGGAFAMGVVFYVLKWFNRLAEIKRGYHPRMTRILFKASSQQPDD